MKISLVMPVYNEEKVIAETLKKLEDYTKNSSHDWEILLVNDGSTDNTQSILKDSSKKGFKIISYEENKGKGFAIKTGVKHATGDFICFTDSDLAYSLDHLDRLLEKLSEYPVVIGTRDTADERNDTSFTRKVMGKGFNVLAKLILGYQIGDTQCGIKGFKKEVAKDIFPKQTLEGFSFDTEILYLANKRGHEIGKISATVSDSHKKKKTKVSVIKDPIIMFVDLIKIRLNDKKGKYDSEI